MASCFLTGRHRGTASCCACTGSSHPSQAPKAAPKSVQETLAQGVKAMPQGPLCLRRSGIGGLTAATGLRPVSARALALLHL